MSWEVKKILQQLQVSLYEDGFFEGLHTNETPLRIYGMFYWEYHFTLNFSYHGAPKQIHYILHLGEIIIKKRMCTIIYHSLIS